MLVMHQGMWTALFPLCLLVWYSKPNIVVLQESSWPWAQEQDGQLNYNVNKTECDSIVTNQELILWFLS